MKQPTAAKLRAALRIPGFERQLAEYLGEALVDLERFPQLKLLCWNRRDRFVTDRDAFGLYERNWRFVDANKLDDRERALIDKLSNRYGNGVLNV